MNKELEKFLNDLQEKVKSKDWERMFQRVNSGINDNGLMQFDLKISFREKGSKKKRR